MKILAVLFVSIVNIFAASYTLDKNHSNVGFKVRYMMLSHVKGHFSEFEGAIQLDDNNQLIDISGTVNVSSINTDNQKRDAHLLSDDFFNAEVYPNIQFKSEQVKKTDIGYVVVGSLEIHGIKKPVAIPIEVTDIIVDQYGNKRFGVSGDVTINRKEFGVLYSKKMDNGGLIVDDYVTIMLEVQAVQGS